MRPLTSTLLAAQRQASHVPCVRVEVSNRLDGLVRLDWERLYTGVEADYFHCLAVPGDGSLLRARITPPSDGRKLYRQRVANPGPTSDFSPWTYASQYNCVVVASAALGSEVSLLWINTAREIRRIKSSDSGASWGSPELLDYSPTAAINGLAAAYKPNGDLALFFADQATLYVKKCIGGVWQPKSAWGKTTGDLSGVAAVYATDWDLLVTGKDTAGDFKLWSLVYGDGGEVGTGTWSALNELATAPAGGDFLYLGPFIDRTDVFRCFFVEKYVGSQPYSRPYWAHSLPVASYAAGLWREPVPFDLSSEYGLAMAHTDYYCWLSAANGVWRASLTSHTIELTGDVLSLRAEQSPRAGSVEIELRNDDGRYSALPSPLGIGCELSASPGYLTAAGNETSPGLAFTVEALEYRSSPGKAGLILRAFDGWSRLETWSARSQLRWNKSGNEKSVKDILAFVLARVGLRLQVESESMAISSFFPDFTIHAGDRGDAIVERLLSLVPDLLFIEGNSGHLVNPGSEDPSVYGYGTLHAVLEGKYVTKAKERNVIRVEGYDPAAVAPIIVDSFDWDEIGKLTDRNAVIEDRNLSAESLAQQRGEAVLRKLAIASTEGRILVPVNCGQQVYDVIDITDGRAGLAGARRRVAGLTLLHYPGKGQYMLEIGLGAV